MNYYFDFTYTLGFIGIICICIYTNLKIDDSELKKKKIIILYITEVVNYFVIANLIIHNIYAYVLFQFFGGLVLAIVIFNNEKLNILVSYLISIFIIQIIEMMIYSSNSLIFAKLLIGRSYEILTYSLFKLLYIYIVVILCFIFREFIKNIEFMLYYNIKGIRVLALFVILCLGIRILISGKFNVNISYLRITAMIIIGGAAVTLLIHSIEVEKKARIADELNEQLEVKNSELRKIKHDYGAQISYLYGLYLLERWDSLGEAIDNIIENNNSVLSSVLLNEGVDSKITQAVNKLLQKGIHVIIEENADIKIIKIEYNELISIIKEICEAILHVIGEQGLIKIRTYIRMDQFIINFESSNLGYIYSNEREKNKYTNIKKSLKILLKDVISMVSKNNGKIYIKKGNNLFQIKIKFPV